MLYDQLSDSLVKCVVDTSIWSEALQELCNYTSTRKALISIRDLKTAKIIVPNDVSAGFASPLIYGFSEEEVETYLTKFVDIDVWTPVEQANYPYFPYAMSRYLELRTLKQSEFWDWLEPQNINDCIVCELGRTDQYWAALNLYFDGLETSKANIALERLRSVLPSLRSAWSASREFQLSKTSEDALTMVLDAMNIPAALISGTGDTLRCNRELQDLSLSWEKPIRIGTLFSLPRDVLLSFDESRVSIDLIRTDDRNTHLRAHIIAFQSAEFAGGERRNMFLVSCSSIEFGSVAESGEIWENPALTIRERELVKLVALGHKFRIAQLKMELSYPRIMQLWKSSRDKLGFANVNDLRLAYELQKKK